MPSGSGSAFPMYTCARERAHALARKHTHTHTQYTHGHTRTVAINAWKNSSKQRLRQCDGNSLVETREFPSVYKLLTKVSKHTILVIYPYTAYAIGLRDVADKRREYDWLKKGEARLWLADIWRSQHKNTAALADIWRSQPVQRRLGEWNLCVTL